ncbi:hypothetical protein F4802DRAFT_121008 [Xylaria palmicola]|nr:hypothetical protein F4802DRAFT_121008 [Xylaria palmicola]
MLLLDGPACSRKVRCVSFFFFHVFLSFLKGATANFWFYSFRDSCIGRMAHCLSWGAAQADFVINGLLLSTDIRQRSDVGLPQARCVLSRRRLRASRIR